MITVLHASSAQTATIIITIMIILMAMFVMASSWRFQIHQLQLTNADSAARGKQKTASLPHVDGFRQVAAGRASGL